MDQETVNDTDTKTKEANSEGMNSKAEQILESAKIIIEEMKVSLGDQAAEIEELHKAAADQEEGFKTQLEEANSKIEGLQKALEEATKAKEEALEDLGRMKEDALLQERLLVLKDADLLRKDIDAQVGQANRVIAMSEEQFADYYADLLDISGKQANNSSKEDENIPSEEVTDAPTKVEAKSSDKAATDVEAEARIRHILKSLSVKKVTEDTDNQEASEEVEVEIEGAEETFDEEVSKELSKETASNKVVLPSIAEMAQGFTAILKLEKSN